MPFTSYLPDGCRGATTIGLVNETYPIASRAS
jgi:hypothetical protein